ncbi:hypothetical protein [Clostridium sp. D53t1_180928_C8]|uniref:hypothetical protein n=1 Tax=Clostridium sp. D53t1_180928_C8 TaxID=2787101 RepID=UPI0018ABB25F|nr:hypothetical protein [Clostridium sp. D53t1_180928_C8]
MFVGAPTITELFKTSSLLSIITTVYIPKGIAMDADSRLTGTTTHNNIIDRHTISDNSQKLFLLKNNTIGIACCGDAIIARRSVGDFFRQFEIDNIDKSDNILTIVIKLRDYTISMHGFGVNYQVSGYLDDVPYMYTIINDQFVRENVNENGI